MVVGPGSGLPAEVCLKDIDLNAVYAGNSGREGVARIVALHSAIKVRCPYRDAVASGAWERTGKRPHHPGVGG